MCPVIAGKFFTTEPAGEHTLVIYSIKNIFAGQDIMTYQTNVLTG